MNDMLFLNSDLFFADPDAALKKIYAFLGVDTEFVVPNTQKRNVANNRTRVEPAVYDYLDDYFRPYNQALYDLLEEDYGW